MAIWNRPIALAGVVKNNSWGKGEESIISSFKHSGKHNRYAEYWLGAHPSGAANIIGTEQNLLQLINQYPNKVLGRDIAKKYNQNFPFLFKVLSVAQALSIQTHPNAELAVELHKKNPTHYPDPFPKPEVGIAINTVKLLYGFRPLTEIKDFISNTLELSEMLQHSESIKELYSQLMQTDEKIIHQQSKKLYTRLRKENKTDEISEQILKLENLYPEGDVGIFNFYFLNLVTLRPEEAIFIAPNIPHAYLSGDLIECMAPSDNVVRAGLTPKYMDVNTLLEMVEDQESLPNIINANSRGEYLLPISKYFRLSTLKTGQEVQSQNVVELIFCLSEGSINFDGEEFNFAIGDAMLISAMISEKMIKVSSGVFYHTLAE